MKKFLLIFIVAPLSLVAQQNKKTPDMMFDSNSSFTFGFYGLSKGLLMPPGTPLPLDYSTPPISTLNVQLGFRFPLTDISKNANFSADIPLELGWMQSSGPSSTYPSDHDGMWISLPLLITVNAGCGSSEDADGKVGLFFGGGAAINTPVMVARQYAFDYTVNGQGYYIYRFKPMMTLNGIAGIRWQGRRYMHDIGVQAALGADNTQIFGIAYGRVF